MVSFTVNKMLRVLVLVAGIHPTAAEVVLRLMESVAKVCTTVALLLLTVTQPCPIIGHACYTLWISKTSEDMRHTGKWFQCQVKLLTTRYKACCVKTSQVALCNSDIL